jgi:putative NIF3 family GTP cyclohydrolase 1 type 2
MIYKIIRLCILLGLCSPLTAQTTLKVATKNIRKTLNWKSGQEVMINCEKAEIEVAPASGNTVQVQAELSARHPNADSARADLNAWQLVVDQVGKKLVIRAYIGVASGKALPASNFKALIKVWLPADCPVNIANKFGKARLEKLDGPVAASGEFCQFQLVQLKGRVEVDSRYGQIDAREVYGPLQIQSKRADIQLSKITHSCTLNTEYGSVAIQSDAQTGNIAIKSSKTDITLRSPANDQHNLDIKNTYGSLTVADHLSLQTAQPDKNTRTATRWKQQNQRQITIEARFGQVTIK